ncbi:hypothetical protein D3C81_1869430 [compost metagenome]
MRRTVVVRHNLQRRIRAHVFGKLGQFDRFGSRVAAGTGDDRDALGGVFHRDADQLAMFIN